MKKLSINKIVVFLFFALAVLPQAAFAGDAASVTGAAATYVANNTWMLVSTFLVFIMHLGFASLEAGLTRSKNTVNILFKNTAIISIGLLTYAIVGFNLMYPGEFSISGVFGFSGFGIGVSPENMMVTGDDGVGIYTYWTDFIFQAMFAATAATIVSGAVAERIKLSSFLIFSTIYVALVYPWVGSWKWGGGWLDAKGFYDFAGSTLVHSVGGWAALAGVLILGPRIGKYVGGGIKPIMGHNMPLAAIGVFLLWLGWFGFNGGSVLSADPTLVSFVFVTTSLAAAAGVVGAMILSWFLQKKPDLTMALNGALAAWWALPPVLTWSASPAPLLSVLSPACWWLWRFSALTGSRWMTPWVPFPFTWSAASGEPWPSAFSARTSLSVSSCLVFFPTVRSASPSP